MVNKAFILIASLAHNAVGKSADEQLKCLRRIGEMLQGINLELTEFKHSPAIRANINLDMRYLLSTLKRRNPNLTGFTWNKDDPYRISIGNMDFPVPYEEIRLECCNHVSNYNPMDKVSILRMLLVLHVEHALRLRRKEKDATTL